VRAGGSYRRALPCSQQQQQQQQLLMPDAAPLSGTYRCRAVLVRYLRYCQSIFRRRRSLERGIGAERRKTFIANCKRRLTAERN